MALAVDTVEWKAQGSGTTLTIPLTSPGTPIAVGDVIHVDTYTFANSTHTPGAPSDNAAPASTWHARTTGVWSATFRSIAGQAYSLVGEGGGGIPTSVTVRGNNAATHDIAGCVKHLMGVDNTTPVNTSTANTIGGTTGPTHTAITSALPDELWIAASTHDGAAITPGAPTGFTLDTTTADYNGSAAEPFGSAHKIFATTQTALAPAWVNSAAANYGLALIAYRAASSSTVPAAQLTLSAAPPTVGEAANITAPLVTLDAGPVSGALAATVAAPTLTLGSAPPAGAEAATATAALLTLGSAAPTGAEAATTAAPLLTLGSATPTAAEAAPAAPAALLTLSAATPTLVMGGASLIVAAPSASLALSAATPAGAEAATLAAATVTLSAAAGSVTLQVSTSAPSLALTAATAKLAAAATPTAALLTLSAAAPSMSTFTIPTVATVRYFPATRTTLHAFTSPTTALRARSSPAAAVRAR